MRNDFKFEIDKTDYLAEFMWTLHRLGLRSNLEIMMRNRKTSIFVD
jgi:hypothetical protein